MTISKAYTVDINDPRRKQEYLENYKRIFGRVKPRIKEDTTGDEMSKEIKKKQESK